jgi:hypothetical protein
MMVAMVSFVRPDGLVDWDVGLCFRVNGRRKQDWRIMVAYEPSDTYTVYLWRTAKPTEERAGLRGVVINRLDDVYGEDLKGVVEQMYDRAIKEHNGGFIPI